MEQVIFHKTLAPHRQTDRVKRATSRGGSGNGSSFSNQLRQRKEDSSGSPSSSQEDAELSTAPLAAEEAETARERLVLPKAEPSPLAGKKRIDVRV